MIEREGHVVLFRGVLLLMNTKKKYVIFRLMFPGGVELMPSKFILGTDLPGSKIRFWCGTSGSPALPQPVVLNCVSAFIKMMVLRL